MSDVNVAEQLVALRAAKEAELQNQPLTKVERAAARERRLLPPDSSNCDRRQSKKQLSSSKEWPGPGARRTVELGMVAQACSPSSTEGRGKKIAPSSKTSLK